MGMEAHTYVSYPDRQEKVVPLHIQLLAGSSSYLLQSCEDLTKNSLNFRMTLPVMKHR